MLGWQALIVLLINEPGRVHVVAVIDPRFVAGAHEFDWSMKDRADR